MPSFVVKMYENRFMSYTIICIMRTFLVLIAWCVAILIPEFQLAVSFVGGKCTDSIVIITVNHGEPLSCRFGDYNFSFHHASIIPLKADVG